MNYSEIENKLVERLKEYHNYDISVFPDDPSEYILTHPNAGIVVKFAGSSWNAPQIIQQALLIQYEIYIISRMKRQKTLDLMEEVRQTLTSDFFIDNSRFYVTGESESEYTDGTWYYKLNLTLPFISLQGY
jgi:hypothetical protein